MNSTETLIGITKMARNGGGSACIEGVGLGIGGGSSDITRDGWDG